jgi:dihydroneopterin aldolase
MHRDQLSIEGLRLRCALGTQEPEKLAQQDVVVTFSVYANLSMASRSDKLADTIDLGRMVSSVRKYVARAAHELIESLAFEIARILLTDFPVQEATVTVRKPTAFGDAYCESVTLTRQRSHFNK